MMLPTSHFLTSPTIRVPPNSWQEIHNTPEENDETMNKECESSPFPELDSSPRPKGHSSLPEHASSTSEYCRFTGQGQDQDQYTHSRSLPMDNSCFGRPGNREQQEDRTHSPSALSYRPYQAVPGIPAGYSQVTPFPSQAGDSWHPPSISSSWSGPVYPNSLPSCLSPCDYSNRSGESCYSKEKFMPLPGRYSPRMHSLEQPHSLHSNPPSLDMHHHRLSPYYCSPQGAPCCAQCPPEVFKMAPMPHRMQRPGHCPPCRPLYSDCSLPVAGFINSGHDSTTRQKNVTNSTPLSLEQRKVFVTYEADSDEHINEIIKFVALLRTNGFDTHIDMFEQQFRSISKIDFMERYLSEKEYLIIIVISPKYYGTVTASPGSLENDERTVNTVYIHKQLQNEFIQNGSKNYRFIPILFPGAKKYHVPTWLQNTHVYGWPQGRDDILRRLMRVEKYNPPPVGELPTIVPIPI